MDTRKNHVTGAGLPGWAFNLYSILSTDADFIIFILIFSLTRVRHALLLRFIKWIRLYQPVSFNSCFQPFLCGLTTCQIIKNYVLSVI